MGCYTSGHEVRTRQTRTELSHAVSAVDTNVIEARIVPESRRQSESTGEGTAANVNNDGIYGPRAGKELSERRNQFLKVPLLILIGVEQGQVVRRQSFTWGIEVRLTAANGRECLVDVQSEERVTP